MDKKSNPTVLARDLEIEGQIVSQGIIEIEGKIKGTLKGGAVIIRETGIVQGEIFAENTQIKGNFQGKLHSKTIAVASKAVVNGEIEYSTLSVEDGASIDGNFKKIQEGQTLSKPSEKEGKK